MNLLALLRCTIACQLLQDATFTVAANITRVRSDFHILVQGTKGLRLAPVLFARDYITMWFAETPLGLF